MWHHPIPIVPESGMLRPAFIPSSVLTRGNIMNEEIVAVLRTIQVAKRQIAEAKRRRMENEEVVCDFDDVEMGLEWLQRKLEALKNQEEKLPEA
jgi:hypothetical protein